MSNHEVYNNIRQLRERLQMTPTQLAEASGLSLDQLIALEAGTLKTISSKKLLCVSKTLGIDVNQLFSSESDDGTDSKATLDIMFVAGLYLKLSPENKATVKNHIYALLDGEVSSPKLLVDEAKEIHRHSSDSAYLIQAAYAVGFSRGRGEHLNLDCIREICGQVLASFGNAIGKAGPKASSLPAETSDDTV